MIKSKMEVLSIDPNGLFAKFLYPKAFSTRINETRFKQNWKLSKFEYACLMRNWNGEGNPLQWVAQYMKNFVGPRNQRGSVGAWVQAAAAQQGAGSGESVVLTNHSFSSSDFGNLVTSRAAFQADGTLVHQDDGVDSDVQAGEWNSAEPSGTGADFEVRYTSASKTGSTYTNPAAAGDTWIRIDADRSWGHRIVAKGSPALLSSSATFELGDYLASSADDSATLTISAEN